MTTLRVTLFGTFQVRQHEHALTGLDLRKAQELFCYLLLFGKQAQPRESLSTLLWQDQPITVARKYLRQALWQLQTALETNKVSDQEPVLLTEADAISVNPSVDMWLDVSEFETAYERTKKIPGNELEGHSLDLVQSAVELHQAELLPGWYQDWCLFERERFKYMYEAMLGKLVHHAESQGDYVSGLEYGLRILRQDPAHELTHQRMMRLYFRAGDRTNALRQYLKCTDSLMAEFGTQPSAKTERLRQQICAGENGSPAIKPDAGEQPEFSTEELLTMVTDLTQTASELATVQQKLQKEVQVLKSQISNDRSMHIPPKTLSRRRIDI